MNNDSEVEKVETSAPSSIPQRNPNSPKFILLTGAPLSVNHLYATNGKQRFITKDGRARKEAYAWEVRSQYRGLPMEGAVHVEVTLYFENMRRRDSDNALKTIFDALSGIAIEDDSQITDHSVHRRLDKENPRVELIITPYGITTKERLAGRPESSA